MCNVENVFINILNIQQRIYVNQVSAICFEISHKLDLTALFLKTPPLKSNSCHTFLLLKAYFGFFKWTENVGIYFDSTHTYKIVKKILSHAVYSLLILI